MTDQHTNYNDGMPPAELKDPIWADGHWQERNEEQMPEHLSGQAIGQKTTAWCKTCGRFTLREVFRVAIGSKAGKPGPCLEHKPNYFTRAQAKRREKEKREEQNPRLF